MGKFMKSKYVWAVRGPGGRSDTISLRLTKPDETALAWAYVQSLPEPRGWIEIPQDIQAAKKAGYRIVRYGLIG